jgi:hypothetical protein
LHVEPLVPAGGTDAVRISNVLQLWAKQSVESMSGRISKGPAESPSRTHAKLEKMAAPAPRQYSPPPYSCTRVRTLRPLSGAGVTSAAAPPAAGLQAAAGGGCCAIVFSLLPQDTPSC